MSAFVIFDVDIREMSRYKDFMQTVKPVLDAAGARLAARSTAASRQRWAADPLLLPRRHAYPLAHPIIRMIDDLFARLDAGDDLRAQAGALADLDAALEGLALFHGDSDPVRALHFPPAPGTVVAMDPNIPPNR